MTRTTESIENLPNIGPTVAKRLKEIGINTRAELEAMGPSQAYKLISAHHPEKNMPVCYYLYSLEGALRNQHWDTISEKKKQSLLKQIGRL